jgi:hypothetical protein
MKWTIRWRRESASGRFTVEPKRWSRRLLQTAILELLSFKIISESLGHFHGFIWPRSLDRPPTFVVHYYAEKGLCRTHTLGPFLDGQRTHAFVS